MTLFLQQQISKRSFYHGEKDVRVFRKFGEMRMYAGLSDEPSGGGSTLCASRSSMRRSRKRAVGAMHAAIRNQLLVAMLSSWASCLGAGKANTLVADGGYSVLGVRHLSRFRRNAYEVSRTGRMIFSRRVSLVLAGGGS